VVTTATLRRRLAGEPRRGAQEDLLSRRRSLRARRPETGPPGEPAVTLGPALPPTLEPRPPAPDGAPRLA
jgi:hypothetical protein